MGDDVMSLNLAVEEFVVIVVVVVVVVVVVSAASTMASFESPPTLPQFAALTASGTAASSPSSLGPGTTTGIGSGDGIRSTNTKGTF